ncbi:MAG: MotA/TolQ/ExbB proton channel family protein [Ignavibacteria bacterium]|nr:MotA/TolQ/ExbB proton channel family protein [Ignavibacteria bacterium]
MKIRSVSLIGLALGVFSIFGAFLLEGGSYHALFLASPLLIVFGGTFAAIIIGFGMDKFLNIFSLIKIAYFPKKYNLQELINIFIDISIIIRKDGFLAVEKDLNRLLYPFPQKMVKYVLDGNDADSLTNLASLEIRAMQARHSLNILIFTKMGGYAPTMGILGTVMGLIMTLANVGDDPNGLIRNIATAFIATLWGVFSANIFWFPISDKLKLCHLEEKQMMEVSIEGILALQAGEIPSMVKARLLSLIPPRDQEKIL